MAQSREALIADQKKLNKKIALTNRLLSENRSNHTSSLSELKLLQSQVNHRKDLIRSYNLEIERNKKEHTALLGEAKVLKDRRDQLQSNYQGLLRATYRSKLTQNKWLFLLSAASFHQVLQRWRYLRQISKAWQKQIDTWHQANAKLADKAAELSDLQASKEAKLAQVTRETAKLSKAQKDIEEMISTLAQDEKRLLKNLRSHQKSLAKLKAAIERAVSKNTSGATRKLPLTPAMLKLADNFEANKGALPWPVAQGIVSRKFGTQQHPFLPNVKIKNNGIDIETTSKSEVHTIFDGTVIALDHIPGFQQMVIVSHGNFYTVYSNLQETEVVVGDKIQRGDTIGFAGETNGTSQVHLEIWKGKVILDPSSWLKNQ